MTLYEWLAVGISVLSLIVSLFSFIKNRKIAQGRMELEIHQMIAQTKKDVIDIALKMTDGSSELLKQAFKSANELNLNAYEEACAEYLDKKVDRERFKKDYFIEIRNLVEYPGNKEKLSPTTSRYQCILKVYREWNQME